MKNIKGINRDPRLRAAIALVLATVVGTGLTACATDDTRASNQTMSSGTPTEATSGAQTSSGMTGDTTGSSMGTSTGGTDTMGSSGSNMGSSTSSDMETSGATTTTGSVGTTGTTGSSMSGQTSADGTSTSATGSTTEAVTTTGAGGAMAGSAGDSALHAQVHSALQSSLGGAGSAIQVQSSGGVVTLTGTVSSQAEVDQAVQAARSVPGVSEVRSANLRFD